MEIKNCFRREKKENFPQNDYTARYCLAYESSVDIYHCISMAEYFLLCLLRKITKSDVDTCVLLR